MKYIPYLAIALCFLLLLGYTRDLGKEISGLKEGYRLQGEEIRTLRAYIQLNDENAEQVIAKAEWVIDEVREMATVTYTRFIPISGGFLGLREEEKDVN